MKNLNPSERKSRIKSIVSHTLLILPILILCFYLAKSNINHIEFENKQKELFKVEQQMLLESYECKIDSILIVNEQLAKSQSELLKRLDSISKK